LFQQLSNFDKFKKMPEANSFLVTFTRDLQAEHYAVWFQVSTQLAVEWNTGNLKMKSIKSGY